MTTFAALNLASPIQRALDHLGYETPTPIQAQAIPPLLEGRDVLGCAQTGTGKTAAFALPILQLLSQQRARGPRLIKALVLSPTRELAIQIGESFADYGRHLRLRHTVIFGGVNEKPQIRALEAGLDVLVATPGRLLDLMGRGYIDLQHVDFFVLDEADRMLDMGFIHDIRRVMKALPSVRQNLLFSATMPAPIVELAAGFLRDPIRVEVAPQSTTVERIEQRVMFVERADKRRLLAHLLQELNAWRTLVFTRTKHGANRLVKQLAREGVTAAPIHGNKSQAARQRALAGFRAGDIPVLVATDIAARGIDVDDITHVFNFDLPNEPESYVHRIGRTGRAGREGVAISFCDSTEGAYLRDIERLINLRIPTVEEHPWHSPEAVPPLPPPPKPRGRRSSKPAPKGRSVEAPRPEPPRPEGGDKPKPRRRRRRRGGAERRGPAPQTPKA